MQLITKRSVATVMMIVLTASCVFSYNGRYDKRIETNQDREVHSWVERSYRAVLNSLLPDGAIEQEQFPKDVKWIVTVRILAPFERPEYRYSMSKGYSGRVKTSIISVKGTSLTSQLYVLKKKHPDATLEQIASLVSVEHRTITQSDCSRLHQLANQFETINMSPVLPDELRIDDTGYEFWSQALWGNRMNIFLSGPGPKAKKQPHPLLQWAESVRGVTELCRER